MRLIHLHAARRVVAPHGFSRSRVEGVQVNALGRPNSGPEVHHAVGDGRTAPRRPARDHPVVAQHQLAARPAAKGPLDATVGRVQTVQQAVVAGDEHPVLPDGGGEPHRAIGECRPQDLPRRRVAGDHFIVGGRAVVQSPPGGHDMVRPVVRHPLKAGPRRRRRMRLDRRPAQRQRRRQLLGRIPAPRCIGPVARPIRSAAVGRNSQHQDDDGEKW